MTQPELPLRVTDMQANQALLIVILCLVTTWLRTADAHSGGLNAEGCHNNRKTGEYHCHGGKKAATPKSQSEEAPATANQLHGSEAANKSSTAIDHPFRNCTEARALGAAPVRRGQPGYGPHLDRDNDGIGCEPYRGR